MKQLYRFAISFGLCVGISYLFDLVETLFTGVAPTTKPQSVLVLSAIIATLLTVTWKFPEKEQPRPTDRT